MRQLLDAIQSQDTLFRGDIPNFDIEELVRFLGSRVVQTSGRNFAVAMHKDDPSDYSNRTEFFDWHSDGLYHAKPPRFVLLHCVDPGTGQVRTELNDVRRVRSMLTVESHCTLQKLRSHYLGHGGDFAHEIFYGGGMLLASRGYVSPLPGVPLEDVPSIREIAHALSELYDHLDASVLSINWTASATLVFDQYRYMHRRQSATIDLERKLIRMWFN
jgi:hypothetical protein